MPPPPEFVTQYWAFVERHTACSAAVDVVTRLATAEEAQAGAEVILSARCPACEEAQTFHLTGPDTAYIANGEMTHAAAAELQAAFKTGRRRAAPSRRVH